MLITDLIIGGSSAIIARTINAPLELYRVQRQNPFIPNTTLKDVVKKEGIRYLWKGNATNCIRAFPQFAITYSTYNYISKNTENLIKNNNYRNLFAGGIAGALSQTIIYPLETSRSYLSLQTNKNKYKGILDILTKIPTKKLYRGLPVGIAMHTPWNSIQLTSYSYLSKIINEKYTPNIYTKLFIGASAGVISITCVYPTDLIRRRLQLQGFDKNVPKYNSGIDCFKKIVRTEGIKGLYRGLLTNYPKTIGTFSVQYLMIDYLNNLFTHKIN